MTLCDVCSLFHSALFSLYYPDLRKNSSAIRKKNICNNYTAIRCKIARGLMCVHDISYVIEYDRIHDYPPDHVHTNILIQKLSPHAQQAFTHSCHYLHCSARSSSFLSFHELFLTQRTR